MDRLLEKFARKFIDAGLASDQGSFRPLVAGLDDILVWNRQAGETAVLEQVFRGLSINSLVFLRPKEPYRTIIGYLARHAGGVLQPKDCETRTFLHDLPVVDELRPEAVIHALKGRKCVIVAPQSTGGRDGPAIVAHGTVSPEQGFVAASSVCFACFVKFFADYMDGLQGHGVGKSYHEAVERAKPMLDALVDTMPKLMRGPFSSQAAVYKAISQAGREIVKYRLVDSYFGNISYCWNDTLYISQTGSSLDELEGCVDPVPLDGSTSAGITASSELSAHLEVVARTGCRAILHGHPKFCVIASMDCPMEEKAQCRFTDQCHINCPKPRFAGQVPIIPGEVGNGPTGLCHTLPPALENHQAAIVYGHGLFTTGGSDFNAAFRAMVDTETMCRRNYFDKVAALRK